MERRDRMSLPLDPHILTDPFLIKSINPPPHAVVVAANGEIYNYKELYEEMGGSAFYQPKTGSDCEVRSFLVPTSDGEVNPTSDGR